MVGSVWGVDPNWIIAGLAAGGAVLAAYRWFRASTTRRKRQQSEYRSLWQDYYGTPALVDENGVEYQAAKQGTKQKVELLKGEFYGHTDHPPSPGGPR